MYTFGAVGHKGQLVRFEVKTSKVTATPQMVKKHSDNYLFSCLISRMCWHILMNLITATHYQVQMMLMAFQGYEFRSKGRRQHCLKSSF